MQHKWEMSMRINFIQEFLDKIKTEIDYKSKIPYKLFYIGNAKNSNAGDMFNVNIMQYFHLPFIKTRISAANMLNVGSVLGQIVVPKNSVQNVKQRDCIIIGSGFIEEEQFEEKLIKDIKIYALRGELTKKRLEKLLNKEINCPLADPGLLISYLYPLKCAKKYKVGIIPHYVDKKADFLKCIKLEKYNYKIVDIEQNIKVLSKDINECELILSSSLHGLIFADSYNIPNRQIIMSNNVKGGLYKFKDYYSSFNMNLPEPVDLRQRIIDDSLVERIAQEYKYNGQQIEVKQKELIEIYSNLSNSCK